MTTKQTYAGIPDEFGDKDQARVVLIPVAYDGTSTWQKGADKGPEAFLHASENMELYDIETDSEVYREGIYLEETLEDFESPEQMVNAVYEIAANYINSGKFTTLFGGEHSISIGAIRAMANHYQHLTVLQIDAHADLRASYEGTPYNHACAVYEARQRTNLVQVGVRSMDRSELEVMDTDRVIFAHDMQSYDWKRKAMELLTDTVYITVDLDAFDPSILPATGTPEPGGMGWYETLEFLKGVFKAKNVVGFDIVELCPNAIDKSSDFLAAKLYYKMLSYKFCQPKSHSI